MGSERQTLKDADRSETAKRLPGSGRSLLAQLVLALVPVPALPVLVLPRLAWRRLAWRRLVFSVLLCLVLLCLVLPSSAPLFSALVSLPRPF